MRPLQGKPLIAWTIEAAQGSQYIDRMIVSSDDQEIIEVARQYGADIPFLRPAYLSDSKASSVAVVLHALDELNGDYDWLLLLQPTSPLRTSADIDAAIDLMADNAPSSVVSMCKVDKSPYWMYRKDVRGQLQPVLPECDRPQRRQDVPDVLVPNGAIYCVDIEKLHDRQSFIYTDTLPYIMSAEYSVDIDDLVDFMLTEVLIQYHRGC